MLTKLRSNLSYANVMASIAVFIALGGTSAAAVSLKKNSVGTRQIKNSSLTGTDVKNSSLTSKDVKDKSLLAKDFRSGQLPAGPRGATGPTGATGATGAAGSARAYALVSPSAPTAFVPAQTKGFTSVTRPGTGTYCLTAPGIDPRAVTAAVSFDAGLSASVGIAGVRGTGLGCPDGQFEVRTYTTTGTSSDSVGFSLVVP